MKKVYQSVFSYLMEERTAFMESLPNNMGNFVAALHARSRKSRDYDPLVNVHPNTIIENIIKQSEKLLKDDSTERYLVEPIKELLEIATKAKEATESGDNRKLGVAMFLLGEKRTYLDLQELLQDTRAKKKSEGKNAEIKAKRAAEVYATYKNWLNGRATKRGDYIAFAEAKCELIRKNDLEKGWENLCKWKTIDLDGLADDKLNEAIDQNIKSKDNFKSTIVKQISRLEKAERGS